MLKATALCAISNEERQTAVSQITALPQFSQNIIIEPSNGEDTVPESVISLSYRIMEHDEILKDIINDLRALFVCKREDFHISLSSKSQAEREIIIGLFQDMVGIISPLRYCQDCNMLNGKLSLSVKAQRFITGQYLELALYKETRDLLEVLSTKHCKPYKLYRNVKIATAEGRLKNEFDLVIDFDGIIYVIEIKSGRNFRDFDKYMRIGREYGIVPDRFMLVDNFLSAEQADTAEYFCDYYVTNLQNGNFVKKLTAMIENDL